VMCFHMKLGMQVIIEDYFDKPFSRNILLILNLFAAWLIGAAGVFSILKVAFGGGAY
jgi:succinate dehydrogenase / fumarate reductase membrane anchor subunit